MKLRYFVCLPLLLVLAKPVHEKGLPVPVPVQNPVELTLPDGTPSSLTAEELEAFRLLAKDSTSDEVAVFEDACDAPPPKRSKLNEVDSDTVSDNSKGEKCYFEIKRSTSHETKARPETSEVSKCTSEELISFQTLILNRDDHVVQYGAENEADLVLSRGAGEFEHDWQDENVINEIGKRFICKKHRQELQFDWETTGKHIKRDQRKKLCSFPPTLGTKHGKVKTNAKRISLTPLRHNEAKALLFVENILAHEGIPICPSHAGYAQKTLASHILKENNRLMYPPPITGNLANSESLEADTEILKAQCNADEVPRTTRGKKVNYYESPDKAGKKVDPITPVKDRYKCVERIGPFGKDASCHYESLMDILGISPSTSKVFWKNMSDRNKNRHINAFKRTIKKIAVLAVGENDKDNLIRAANVWAKPVPSGYWQNQAQNEFLEEISKFYYAAESTAERRQILAMVADLYPIGMLENYITGLTSWGYYSAKMAAIRQKNHQVEYAKTNEKPRVKLADLESFVGFISSELITTALPFGDTKKKLINDRVIEVPSAVRSFRASDIILMYKNDMAQRQLPVPLSDSTMRRILEACPAKTKTTLDAVDQFKANGLQAFDWMNEVLKTLLREQVTDIETTKAYTSQLKEAEFFLKADYYNLLQMEHLSADLCMAYALSDPKIPKFQNKKCRVQAQHRYDVQRAFIFDKLCANVLIDLGEHAQKFVDNHQVQMVLQKLEIEVRESQMVIHAWRNHVVRKRFSDNVRAEIFNNLRNGDAIVTIDYAQKWLPRKSMEPQSEYFGKAGLSMHVMHCVFKRFDELHHHTIVHFLGHADQDYVAVTAILISGLKLLKKNHVDNVILRSDNAGYYHNAALLMSIPEIARKANGINILRYSFSEAQAGKSSADVETARLKNVLRSHLNAGNNILTQFDMLEAIDSAIKKNKLYGVTAIVPTNIPNSVKPNKNMDHVSLIGDIEYTAEDDGFLMRYWKHYKIGDGMTRRLTKEDITDLPVKPFGGETYSTAAMPFWRSPSMNVQPLRWNRPVDEVINKDVNKKDMEEEGGLYRCSFEGCTKEYITARSLELHMLSGRHKLVAERETLQETSYKLYADTMLGLRQAHRDYISATTNVKDVEVTFDEEVKPEGWALKRTASRKQKSDNVKNFLKNEFVKQMRRGQKRMNFYEVQDNMRKSEDPLFTAEERLSLSQITSWYRTYSKECNDFLKSRPEDTAEESYEDAAAIATESMVTEDGIDSAYRTELLYREEHDGIMDDLTKVNEEIVVSDLESAVSTSVEGPLRENTRVEEETPGAHDHDELI